MVAVRGRHGSIDLSRVFRVDLTKMFYVKHFCPIAGSQYVRPHTSSAFRRVALLGTLVLSPVVSGASGWRRSFVDDGSEYLAPFDAGSAAMTEKLAELRSLPSILFVYIHTSTLVLGGERSSCLQTRGRGKTHALRAAF